MPWKIQFIEKGDQKLIGAGDNDMLSISNYVLLTRFALGNLYSTVYNKKEKEWNCL